MIDPLQNWETLNREVMSLSETQLYELMRREWDGAARPTFINRIYCRYSVVRREREREEWGLPRTRFA